MNVEPFKKHIYDVIGALHEVHHELGPGLNENCYQEGLELELIERGIPFSREVMFRPRYHGKDMNAHFKLDFLCNHSRMQIRHRIIAHPSRTVVQLHEHNQIPLWHYRQLHASLRRYRTILLR